MISIYRKSAFQRLTNTLEEHWRYRHLVANLVSRELKVRYRGSILGFAWSLLNPLGMTLIFSVVFGILFPSPPIGVSFPAFVLVGILAWNFTTAGVFGSLGSLVNNASLITKLYFPRAILPLAQVLAGLANFLLALVAMLPVLIFLGVRPNHNLLFFPLLILIQVVFLVGLGFILSTLNVLFRDTAQTVEVLMLAWFFLTPVFYDLNGTLSTKTVAGVNLSSVLGIVNPMAPIITIYRDTMLYGRPPALDWLARALGTSLLFLVLGVWTFARTADRLGDEL